MRASKLAVWALLALGGFLLLRHADMAMRPVRPTDMPAGANFVPAGYDIQHLEAKGDWIACSTDSAQNTDFCRVTDARGEVVYQGDFLPLRSSEPIPAEDLKVVNVSANRLWVQGPAEAGPVPVIQLRNGAVLVPADDSEALADRWSNNPAELKRIANEE